MDSITCFRCKQIKDICVSNSNSYYEICVHKTININIIAQNNHHNNDQLVHEQKTDISFNKQHNAQHNEHHNAQHHAQQNEKPIHQILKKNANLYYKQYRYMLYSNVNHYKPIQGSIIFYEYRSWQYKFK